MPVKATMTPKDFYDFREINDSLYLFDGDKRLFKVKYELNSDLFYANLILNKVYFIGIVNVSEDFYLLYIYLNEEKASIYFSEIYSLSPLEIL